jgi:predicted TIM-barrel fold metal-dependent hydrolase
VRREDRLAAEFDALFLGVGPAPRRAFENAAAFELRRHAEDRKDDLGEVGCGIEERFSQRTDTRPGALHVAGEPFQFTPNRRRKRVNEFGWHIQINASTATITEIMPILQKMPSPIVFDHLAHIPEPDGISHPLFAQVRALIDKGKTWVKLSGAYADTKVGPPTYSDSSAIARAYVKAAPERLVWGSDWPHPGVRDPEPKPDDAILIDLMLDWAPDEAVRNRIFVDNAAKLYDFPKR